MCFGGLWDCQRYDWMTPEVLPTAVWFLILKKQQSGINSISAVRDSDRTHLAVINNTRFKEGKKRWMNISASSSHTGLLYSRMALPRLITKHKMWFGALLSCDQTQEFFQIANFANDRPSILIGFWRAAAFWMRDECKGEKGQTCQIHTNAHFQPQGRGGGNMLTS